MPCDGGAMLPKPSRADPCAAPGPRGPFRGRGYTRAMSQAADALTEREGIVPQTADAGPRTRTGWRRILTPQGIAVSSVVIVLVAVLAVHLGPALVGAKTFSAMDRLMAVAPWTDGGTTGPIRNIFLGDSIDALLPDWIETHARLWLGDWPLWSALGGAGQPMMSTTTHPTLTLSAMWALVFPTWYAPGVVKLAEVILAMGGMYLWMRRIGLGRPASALSGVFYIGSGFVVAWATWAGQSSVAAMIPALFWAVERYLAVRTARSAMPVAIVVALLLLGGFPAVAGHALYAGGIYFIVRLIADRKATGGATSIKLFAGGVGAVLLGAAISAIQFLPLLLGLSDTDLSARSRQFFSVEPIRSLLSVFFPESFYDIGFGSGTNPIEAYAFLGMGALFFAAVAVFTRRPDGQARAVVPFLLVGGLLAASLVWYQGWWTDWMSGLPIFEGNKSGRLRDMVGLFGAALAGIGLDRVFGEKAASRRRVLIVAGVSIAVFGALTVAVWWRFPRIPGTTLVTDALPAFVMIGLAGVAVVFARRAWVRTGAFVGVAVMAALQLGASVSNYWPLSDRDDFYPETALISELQDVAGEERILPSRTFMGSTATVYGLRTATAHAFQPSTWREYLEAIDIGAFAAGQTPTNPRVLFPGEENPSQTALLDRLSAVAWVTPSGEAVPGPITMADGAEAVILLDHPDAVLTAGDTVSVPLRTQGLRAVTVRLMEDVSAGDEDVRLEADILDSSGEVLASGEIIRTGFKEGEVTIAVAGESVAGDDLSVRLRPSADMTLQAGSAGVPYVQVTGVPDDGLSLVYADAHGDIWQRESALPRIRWASGSEVVTDAEARLATLADPELDRDTVVLGEDGPPAEGGDAALTVMEDSGDVIRVDVDAESGGYLVVADGMQSGWRVSIDGEPADLVDADHAFGAVFVPAGSHAVTFTYRGEGVAAGMLITGVGLLVVLGVVVFGAVRARRPRVAEGADDDAHDSSPEVRA